MKKALLAAAALSILGSPALAGPNASGTLIAALSEGTVYTTDHSGYCGSSTIESCESAITTWGGGDPAILNIIAAFPYGSAPRLAGLTFGVLYTAGVIILEGGTCGDFELPDGGWPASGSGNAVTWSSAQTDLLIECYWFAAYNYYGGAETFSLAPHPTQGGNFADDDVPSNIDPISGYGTFGFNAPGLAPCTGGQPGACCFPDGSCQVLPQADCEAAGGDYQGDGSPCETAICGNGQLGACCLGEDCTMLTETECIERGGVFQGEGQPCDPNPCIIVPTIESSWGAVKNEYR